MEPFLFLFSINTIVGTYCAHIVQVARLPSPLDVLNPNETKESQMSTNKYIYTPSELQSLIHKKPRVYTTLKVLRETHDHLKRIYPSVNNIKERVYLYINGLAEQPKCECGGVLVWSNSITIGYTECSNKKCEYRKERIKSKRSATNLERYGVEFPLQSDDTKEKVKATNLERYGTEYGFQSEEVKSKIKTTNNERYGVNAPLQSNKFKEKVKATNRERYGTDYGFQSEEVKSKIKSVLTERYGVINPGQMESVREKVKATNQERYGVEYVSQSEEIKERIKATNQERYGVEYAAQSEEIKEKQRQSLWITYYNKNKDVFKFRPLDTSSRTQFGDIVQCKSCGEESEFYHVNGPMSWRCPHCEPVMNGVSNVELDVLNYVKSIYNGEVIHGDRTVLNGKELDIYVPAKNFAIEFNGVYFHSANTETDKEMTTYHLNKTLGCERQGINLMHVWEYDWRDSVKQKIIKSMIRSKLGLGERIYARETEVREVSTTVTKQFLFMNHLQGESASKVNLGLYYQGDLVAIMTFGKPRFNKGYDWELIRYCNVLDVTIVGGASKLLKHFINNHSCSILSYANREHSNGKLYEALGFSLINESQPSYQWVKGSTLLKRYQTQKHKLQSLLGESFDPSKTESENMFANGYRRIWDCGNLVFAIK
jgi:hypothetical protein